MRVLLTGGRGLLGTAVADVLKLEGHESVIFGREFDVSDPMSAARIAIREFGEIDWVVNCAAYTAVDQAEQEPQVAYEVNSLGPSYLSQACQEAGVKLLHISTDFVFDGKSSRPYTEADPVNPLGIYGKTKRQGEEALTGNHLAVVIRTSWLFGPRGKCFPRSILNAYRSGKALRVVADQTGTPTYTPALASRLVEVMKLNPFPGVYHLAGPEEMTWFEFARSLLRGEGNGAEEAVTPITTADWPAPAPRPAYSALNSGALLQKGIQEMPSIAESIDDWMAKFS